MASTSINTTVARAVTFLVQPLSATYPTSTVMKLQLILEANLTAHYASSWVPKEPTRGSGRRVITLSPSCLPPRVIYSACMAVSVQWFDWIALLGNREFDLLVDPACVSVRFGKKGQPGTKVLTVWSDEAALAATMRSSLLEVPKLQIKTNAPFLAAPQRSLGQKVAELNLDNEDDEDLFSMLADEIRVASPGWMTNMLDQFPVPVTPASATTADIMFRQPSSPMHSRSSSRCSSTSSSSSSSGSSDCFSASSSGTSPSSSPSSRFAGLVEPEHARGVFVDTSKTEVTPYDGGKTTVLTGGVMLGGAPKQKSARPSSVASTLSWRSSVHA